MVSAISSGLSGFAAATERLNVSAQNIANGFSTGSIKKGEITNTPYEPQRVVQSSDPTGTVHTHTQPVSPSTISVYDPSNQAADGNGLTQYPNVDVANELVQTQLATYDAQANLSVIKVQNRMLKSVLDIIS